MNNNNVFKLLEEQIELSSKNTKKYEVEILDLKNSSEEFRNHFANQMSNLVYKLEGLMQTNIYTCRETFNNFYNYGNHKCESERKIVNSFKSDFEKMSIIESFNEYIANEIPNFNPKWVTEYYGYSDVDLQVLDRIHNTLQKQTIKYKTKYNIDLPEVRTPSSSNKKYR